MNAAARLLDRNSFSDEPRFDAHSAGLRRGRSTSRPRRCSTTTARWTSRSSHQGHDFGNAFMRHDKTTCLAATTSPASFRYGPGKIDVTFHATTSRTVQRMPRVRFGRVHVYNNFYDVDRNASAPYRLGDSWPSAPLETGHGEQLFDIRKQQPDDTRIINYASVLANRDSA